MSQSWSSRVELIPGNRRASLRHENDAKARAQLFPLMHALESSRHHSVIPPFTEAVTFCILTIFAALFKHVDLFGLFLNRPAGKTLIFRWRIHACSRFGIDQGESWLTDGI